MTITLYGIPNCDTVKRARTWLAGQGADVAFHDFKKAGVPAARLPAWAAAVGWDRLINRQGRTWRQLAPAAQAAAAQAEGAAALVLAEPSVIKRPVVEWADGRITVGFDAEVFARHL